VITMECVLGKAKRKGNIRARLGVVDSDVNHLTMAYEGKTVFPSGRHLKKMIKRYDNEMGVNGNDNSSSNILTRDRFGHVEVYRAVLEMMYDKYELPNISVDTLNDARKELRGYYRYLPGV